MAKQVTYQPDVTGPVGTKPEDWLCYEDIDVGVHSVLRAYVWTGGQWEAITDVPYSERNELHMEVKMKVKMDALKAMLTAYVEACERSATPQTHRAECGDGDSVVQTPVYRHESHATQ